MRYFFCVLVSFFFVSANVSAATYIVTNTNNSGTGSLHAAMTSANSPGADTIIFNITGTAPHTISPTSALPTLTDASTVIDGTTQPGNGYTGASPHIVLDGVNMSGGYGLQLTGSGIELYGLFVKKFPYDGIKVNSAAHNYIIGAPGKRNVISENGYYGVRISGADGGYIQNNYIGTDETGSLDQGNNYAGLTLESSSDNTMIGGSGTDEGNVISGNEYWGIEIECSNGNTIIGNMVGTDVGGIANLGNDYDGIKVHFGGFSSASCNCQNNTIGGLGNGEGNTVAYNGYRGVNICGTNVNYNEARGNSIFCNNYTGISLVDGNYSQPNGNNNYATPSISQATVNGASGTAPNNSAVDLYADDNCSNCEPKVYIGSTFANSSGAWTYTGTLFGSVTAMAVDTGNGNTSANSSCSFVSTVSAPVADFSVSKQSICAGECVNFTDNSTGNPTSWSWSFPGSAMASSSMQNPSGVCYDSSGTYSVTLIVTNLGGMDTLTTVALITVAPQVVASAGPDVTICEGDTVTLQGSGNGNLSWSPTTNLSNPNIGNPIATPDTTVCYVLTVTDTAGCTGMDTVCVFVNASPATPTISMSGDTLVSSAATTYQWFQNGIPIAGATNQNYLPTASGSYHVVITDAFGCTAESAPMMITGIDLDAGLVKLYPNPASSFTRVIGIDAEELILTDALGKVVAAPWRQAGKEIRIETGGLPNGVYAIRIKSGIKTYTGKLLIQ